MKLIYIVSSGHSGSTLVDMLLGSSEHVLSIGEVFYLTAYLEACELRKAPLGFICTCEKPVRDCPFWSEVLAKFGDTDPHLLQEHSGTSRLNWLLRYLLWFLTGRRLRFGASELGDDTALVAALDQVSAPEIQYLCDSSKDFTRLMILLMNPGIEVYPIHLVRDPRGVAHSYGKPLRTELGLPPRPYYPSLLRWVVVNVAARVTLWLSGRPWRVIDYERFTQDPGREVEKLNHAFDLNLSPDSFLDAMNSTERHNIGGNMMRFKKIDRIRTDEAWRQKLTPLQKVLGGVLTFPIYWALSRDRDG